jgi:hypothetical protein
MTETDTDTEYVRLVQLVLTVDQCEMINGAMRDAANSPDVTMEESQRIYDLGYIFQAASEQPSKFPITGKKAASLARALRLGKGPAQPQSRKNKRKARQEARQGWSKKRRKLRAANAKAYNEAVAIQEAEMAEMEAAYAEQQAKLEKEPKFDVFAMDGTRILSGIPESMVRPVEDAPVDPSSGLAEKVEIVLP